MAPRRGNEFSRVVVPARYELVQDVWLLVGQVGERRNEWLWSRVPHVCMYAHPTLTCPSPTHWSLDLHIIDGRSQRDHHMHMHAARSKNTEHAALQRGARPGLNAALLWDDCALSFSSHFRVPRASVGSDSSAARVHRAGEKAAIALGSCPPVRNLF
jgi:hypothetical protein